MATTQYALTQHCVVTTSAQPYCVHIIYTSPVINKNHQAQLEIKISAVHHMSNWMSQVVWEDKLGSSRAWFTLSQWWTRRQCGADTDWEMDLVFPPTQPDNYPGYCGAWAILHLESALRPHRWLFLENELNRVLRGTCVTSTKQCLEAATLKAVPTKQCSQVPERVYLKMYIYILKWLSLISTSSCVKLLNTPK